MSRHEKDLEDMHDLLQQMKEMHGEYHVPDRCEGPLNSMWQSANKMAGSVTDQDILEYYFKHEGGTVRDVIGTSALNKDSSVNIDMDDNSQKGLLLKYCSITKQKNVLDILKSKHPGEHNITAHHTHNSDKDKMIYILKSVTKDDIITSIFNALVEISGCRNEMMTNWTIPKESIKSIIQGSRKADKDAYKKSREGKRFWQR